VTGLSPSTSFPPVIIIPTMLHSSLHLHVAHTIRQTDEGWELSKRSVLPELGEHRVGTYCKRPKRLTGDRIVVSL
jgi:hypothetical protein